MKTRSTFFFLTSNDVRFDSSGTMLLVKCSENLTVSILEMSKPGQWKGESCSECKHVSRVQQTGMVFAEYKA